MVNRYAVVSLLILVTCTSILYAGTTGKIAGKIVDAKTNEPIPMATVVVDGTTLGASSDVNGMYVILNVPPGTYSVEVSYVGYQKVKVTNVGVSVDFTTTLDFPLKESAVELEAVEVRGERNPLIRQDQTNPVAAIGAEQFQALPVTQVSDVVALQAGIVVDDAGGIHVRGGRDDEIAYTLNGMSINNPYDNQSSIGVATNAIQEVSVSTGTFSAEYGNALSGVVNYVTKEGGPKYSGSARVLSGDFVSNRANVFPYIQRLDASNQFRVEGTFGGPIPETNNVLSFYASGVYERNGGYLYGQEIYQPTDFYVSRDLFTWSSKTDKNGKLIYTTEPDINGKPVVTDSNYYDPRSASITSPYYFDPLGRSRFDTLGLPSGNGEIVPLNTSHSYNLQANLSFRISPTMRLKYEVVADNGQSYSTQYYTYRYNPEGRPQNFSNGIIHSLDFTHTISNALFYTLKFSYNRSDAKTYTFDDIHDPRYLPDFYQTALPGTGFLTGGTYLGRTSRWTQTLAAKGDLVAELLDIHEVKLGFEVRSHSLDYEDYALQFALKSDPSSYVTSFDNVYRDSSAYVPVIPDEANGYVHYHHYPIQGAVYLQDKVEIAKSLILNAGVRYEYFDPDAPYNPDVSTELSAQDTTYLTKGLTKASVKQSLSPRVSIAYPITDQGVIRFSYGHFYQIPDLSALYANPHYRAALGTTPSFGNANVRPQRSVQYEIGLQQGLTPDLRLEVVGFYKDVRDYIFSQLVIAAKGDIEYNILTNLSYANSRGITISLLQRRAPGSLFSASLDYTFSISEGNRTEPLADFFYSEKAGKSAETFLVPLSFDRTHVLNATLALTQPDDWSVSAVSRLRSGSPYTPTLPASLATQQTQFIQNSGTKPLQWSVDLKAEKFFSFGGLRTSVYLQVDNVFDMENELDVWTNSGRALYSADQVANPHEFDEVRNRILRGDAGMIPLSAIDNYYVSPLNVSRPRLVQLGLSLYF